MELASSVVANAGTRICFRLGDTDAKRFESGFSFFDANDLQNLDTGEAIIRIERPENDCNLQTLPFEELPQDVATEIKSLVIDGSRSAYGTPKTEVEAHLKSLHTGYEYRAEPELPEIIRPKPKTAPKQPMPIPQPIELSTPLSNSPVEKKQETHHRYLQSLIKKMAESRGYTASIEEPTPDGKGKVDVSLKRNTKRIAVEINDTSKDGWELHNIQKCLDAGYDTVVACSTDAKVIERMQTKIEGKFDIEFRTRILTMTPESLFLFLDTEIAKEASRETRVKGYRVKVAYEAIPEQEMDRKREVIAKSIMERVKSKK